MSSEVQSRPAASRGGRGASRGGRGGFGSRTSTRPRAANGEAKHEPAPDSLASLEDEGEIGELKKLYGAKTSLIKEMFPDWSDVDILFALRETDGDENLTVTRIAEGTISQWDEVSKPKKERAKPKANTYTTTTGELVAGTPRAGRSGPPTTDRRGRAKATPERGGRGARGRSAQPPNGTRPDKTQLSVPTDESHAWDAAPKPDDAPVADAGAAVDVAPAPKVTPKPVDAAPPPKTWASMLRATIPPKVAAKPKEAAPTQKAAAAATTSTEPQSAAPAASADASEDAAETVDPEHEAEESAKPVAAPAIREVAVPEVPAPVAVPDIALQPSKDQLTESNLEQVTDISNPPATDTNQSEAADSWDPRSGAGAPGSQTPISAAQQHQQQQAAQGSPSKTLGSGYAATAIKATDRNTTRTPSYSRRILDQEEAVRMPGHREVDRAAVQFGALNFNGGVEEDIDGDREEPETRAQPPDDSPVAHPRASLPPVAPPAADTSSFAQRPSAAAASTPTVAAAAPAAATALPAAPASMSAVPPTAAVPAAVPPTGPSAQYGRFNQAVPQESAYGQKFDAYSQANQPSATAQYDSFQGLPSSQAQQPAAAVYSSAPNEFSQYYTATTEAQNRMPYNNYYNQTYGQQGHQDAAAPNQRAYGAYPLGDSLNQYPQINASRFGGAASAATAAADAQNSGTTTPNPPVPGQQPQGQQAGAQQVVGGAQAQAAAHSQQQQQQQQQQPYGYSHHPYYTSPFYAQYMNQYGSYNQGNFPPYGKTGYGAGHHPYGIQAPYDHTASQATGFGAASALHRGADSSLGSAGLSDYGRGAAAQSVGQPQQTGFGAAHEASFGRGGAGSYQSSQGFAAAQAQAQQTGGSDDLKHYGDAKGAPGPSPALGGARPGSATNTQAGQAGLPPPQTSQYGNYPSHLQGLHGNQSVTAGGYGMGAGANQNHGNNPYAGYGGHGGHGNQGFNGGGNYYGQQQQQQRGGWGGNYH